MQNLSRHLQEAIQLNTERMPLYNQLSNGQTLPFSQKLIRYENWALHGAKIFDKVGDNYQKQGVPFLEEEFVEMSLTPAFSNHYPIEIDHQRPLQTIDLTRFKHTIKRQIPKKDYQSIVEICEGLLQELEQQTHVYCMVRHLVESMHRIAHLVPQHEQQCQRLGINPPNKYSQLLIWAHLFFLSESEKLDKEVAIIQDQNIPFLFQDLPPIQ